ncbi:MAG: TonB family protein [Gammaproteobacteria bacterium]|nr:hypothetical protein [Gammaproteobacteria bacterium]
MDDKRDTAKQSDALLWLAGAIVVGMGGIWLVLSKPWASDDSIETYTATVSTRPAVPSPEPSQAGRTNLETPLEDNPLRMAQLALEAGMLVEPEEYSAWTLFRKVLQQDPNNTEARDGLDRIATELLRRANAAVEQGRFEDARATVARIREVFPVHTGANDLAIRIDTLTRRAAALAQRSNVLDDDDEPAAPREPERAPEREPERVAAAEPAPAAPVRPAPQVDPMVAAHASFTAALAENQLLTPVGESAKDWLRAMREIDSSHELSRQASSRLFEAFIGRARQAIADMDTAAAETWIDEADGLAVDAEIVGAVRDELRAKLIQAESARLVPASSLEMVSYTAPEYPARALERALDGWVDVEFVVTKDGRTRDVVVTDASHSSYFRREAVAAVEQWRFQPRIFMGEPIEQRAYTRIRFDYK